MGSFEVVLTQLSKARTRTGAVHTTEWCSCKETQPHGDGVGNYSECSPLRGDHGSGESEATARTENQLGQC